VDLEDTLLAFITYTNGAQGVVQASTALWPGTDIRIEMNGTDGTAIMLGEAMQTWKFRDERPEDEQIARIGDTAQATAAGGAADFGHHDHKVVIQDMIQAIQDDREVIIPVQSVRPTVELALAMYQSAAKGTSVELPIEDDPSIW
jgi:predicted dehydrogenase